MEPLDYLLTVLLPVRNKQATLGATIADIMEITAELTDRMELIVVDEGSIDETMDVVCDASRKYPQIRYIRHSEPQGGAAIFQACLREGSGAIIMMYDDQGGLALGEVSRYWQLTDRGRMIIEQPSSLETISAEVEPPLATGTPGYHFFSRKSIEAMFDSTRVHKPKFMETQTEMPIVFNMDTPLGGMETFDMS